MEVSKLIETLRFCGDPESCCTNCPSGDRVTEYTATECLCDLMQKAANAIEELQTQLKSQKCNRDSENAIRLEEKQATSDGWIPVTERLPEKPGRYLICEELGRAMIAGWDTSRWFGGHSYSEFTVYKATHWMPLPEPPKGE